MLRIIRYGSLFPRPAIERSKSEMGHTRPGDATYGPPITGCRNIGASARTPKE